jgi:hypothetical protein
MIKLGSLAEQPVRSILRAVADAAERWSDADFPPRVRVLSAICARTGYSEPVVEYALDRLFFSISQGALETTIVDELGSLDVLDDYVTSADGVRRRALPRGPVCIISSRTTIGVAIVPAIFALCAKCEVLVKDREDRLVSAFFATLAEELDVLRSAARAQHWDGERDARDLEAFDTVVAFGTDVTLARIRASLALRTRLIPFGSKASVGYVGRSALSDEAVARAIAEGAARDLLLYDSEGCLSLHVLFVQRGGALSPGDFAERFARAVERTAVEFPIGTRTPQSVARMTAARDLALFRAANGRTRVYTDTALSYLLVLEPPVDAPPAFLPREIGVYAVDTPNDAAAYIQRHRIPIEAIAVAGARGDTTAIAAELGAARIANFGDLQAPPLHTYHGGRPRIAEFVRWITDQT